MLMSLPAITASPTPPLSPRLRKGHTHSQLHCANYTTQVGLRSEVSACVGLFFTQTKVVLAPHWHNSTAKTSLCSLRNANEHVSLYGALKLLWLVNHCLLYFILGSIAMLKALWRTVDRGKHSCGSETLCWGFVYIRHMTASGQTYGVLWLAVLHVTSIQWRIIPAANERS